MKFFLMSYTCVHVRNMYNVLARLYVGTCTCMLVCWDMYACVMGHVYLCDGCCCQLIDGRWLT